MVTLLATMYILQNHVTKRQPFYLKRFRRFIRSLKIQPIRIGLHSSVLNGFWWKQICYATRKSQNRPFCDARNENLLKWLYLELGITWFDKEIYTPQKCHPNFETCQSQIRDISILFFQIAKCSSIESVISQVLILWHGLLHILIELILPD